MPRKKTTPPIQTVLAKIRPAWVSRVGQEMARGMEIRANFEEQIIPFAKSGYEFFVCPGVSDWSRILPDFGVAQTNIQNFVRDGVKHGALGMINTD